MSSESSKIESISLGINIDLSESAISKKDKKDAQKSRNTIKADRGVIKDSSNNARFG